MRQFLLVCAVILGSVGVVYGQPARFPKPSVPDNQRELAIPAEKRPAFIQETLAMVEDDDPQTCWEAVRTLGRLPVEALADVQGAKVQGSNQTKAQHLAVQALQRKDDETHGRPIHGTSSQDDPEQRSSEQIVTAMNTKADKMQAAEKVVYLVRKIQLHSYDQTILAAAAKGLAGLGKAELPTIEAARDQATDPAVAGVVGEVAFQLKTGVDARAALVKWLDANCPNGSDAAQGDVKAVSSAALAARFSEVQYYTLVARQWPVARMVQPPLKEHNIFAVDKMGKVMFITTPDELADFFRANLGKVDETSGKQAVLAWLLLGQTFVQDGMFTFMIDDASVAWNALDGQRARASGRANVVPGGGNTGFVQVAIEFKDGMMTAATHSAQARPGMRPICQATKLLDVDPLVRRMAERDILIMGESCRWYLNEQREKAAPALQAAMDRIWCRIMMDER